MFFFLPLKCRLEPLGNFLASYFKDLTRMQLFPAFWEGFQENTLGADKPERGDWLGLSGQVDAVRAGATLRHYGFLLYKIVPSSLGTAGGGWRHFQGLLCVSQPPHSPAVFWSPKGDQDVEEKEVGARSQFPPTGTMGAIVFLIQVTLNTIMHTLLLPWEPHHGNFLV
jgi:hypothetical protein